MDEIKPLFTATASVTGGRNGHAAASDGSVSVNLSVPKAMGGPGKPNTTTPEHLFAAGYAACFESAIRFVARKRKLLLEDAAVTATVSLYPSEQGGFRLGVALAAETKGLDQAGAEALVLEAHQICPYSNAIRGNIDVALSTVALAAKAA